MVSYDVLRFLMIFFDFLCLPVVSYDSLRFPMIFDVFSLILLISYDFVWFPLNWEATFGGPRGHPSFVTKVPPRPPKSCAKSCAGHARPKFWSISGGGFFGKKLRRHTPKERYPGAVLEWPDAQSLAMISCGFLWLLVIAIDLKWSLMISHDFLWFPKISFDFSWFLTISMDFKGFLMICSCDFQWFLLVFL